ncbi:peptide deformylase [Membranihabitans maritimus]|uniref:peptide deformylase n=1 Tax=Membranihabitans maritimus TaxID=2904244 RepID=UPI001F0107CB|nr:peptide deformylase [Membranihabitans maritimus]
MILPIYAYGQPVLKKVAKHIDSDFPDLPRLIDDMWETMYNASGVGLAAPQIGKSIRMFIVDTIQLREEEDKENGIKGVFINPEKLEEYGEDFSYEEGCLSIPDIRADVTRQSKLKLKYFNENFEERIEEFEGVNARVIQHEYDHIEGILFIEKINPLKRNILRRKLDKIRKGKINSEYKMSFK